MSISMPLNQSDSHVIAIHFLEKAEELTPRCLAAKKMLALSSFGSQIDGQSVGQYFTFTVPLIHLNVNSIGVSFTTLLLFQTPLSAEASPCTFSGAPKI